MAAPAPALALASSPAAAPLALAPAPMFTEDQKQIIRDTFANGASDAEFAVLLEVARVRRLNPLLKQIHFVQRWDSEKHRMVWSTQVSIDGLRAIAERTGLYQGQDEPEFVENEDGTIKLCKVRVWRKDWPRPAVGVAYWAEYVQTTRDKQTGKTRPTAMWARMPHVMLSKAAESIALRKAFPEDIAGLYSPEEMAQGDVFDAPPNEPERTVQINADLRAASATSSTTTATAPVAEPAAPVVEAPVAAPSPVVDEPRVERDAPAAPEMPDALEEFYRRLEELELPSEGVGVWLKHRTDIANIADSIARENAWKALVSAVERVGRMKNAKVWLKKAIAEEDARTAATAAAKGGA